MTSVLMTSRAVFPPFNSIPLLHLFLSFVTRKVDNKEVKSSTSEDEGFLKVHLTPGFNLKDSKKTGRRDGPKLLK